MMRWALNPSFWKSVAVNVVSAAIIALGSAYFLGLAIYSKAEKYEYVEQVNRYYLTLLVSFFS